MEMSDIANVILKELPRVSVGQDRFPMLYGSFTLFLGKQCEL